MRRGPQDALSVVSTQRLVLISALRPHCSSSTGVSIMVKYGLFFLLGVPLPILAIVFLVSRC